MKKLCWILGVIAVAAWSCKKAKGPKDVPPAQQVNTHDSALAMSVIINGANWKADSLFTYRVANSTNDSDALSVMIVATQKTGVTRTISFNISNFTGVREYVVNPPDNTFYYYVGNERHVASSGSFNVQSDTGGRYSGTFFFVADSMVATSGKFKVARP